MLGGMNKQLHSARTAFEIQQTGSGPAFLGNTPEVFYRHYFDRRQVRVIPQPPPLPEVAEDAPAMRGASFDVFHAGIVIACRMGIQYGLTLVTSR